MADNIAILLVNDAGDRAHQILNRFALCAFSKRIGRQIGDGSVIKRCNACIRSRKSAGNVRIDTFRDDIAVIIKFNDKATNIGIFAICGHNRGWRAIGTGDDAWIRLLCLIPWLKAARHVFRIGGNGIGAAGDDDVDIVEKRGKLFIFNRELLQVRNKNDLVDTKRLKACNLSIDDGGKFND